MVTDAANVYLNNLWWALSSECAQNQAYGVSLGCCGDGGLSVLLHFLKVVALYSELFVIGVIPDNTQCGQCFQYWSLMCDCGWKGVKGLINVFVCVCVFVHVYDCTCIHVCECVCVCVCVRESVSVYVWVGGCARTRARVSISYWQLPPLNILRSSKIHRDQAVSYTEHKYTQRKTLSTCNITLIDATSPKLSLPPGHPWGGTFDEPVATVPLCALRWKRR